MKKLFSFLIIFLSISGIAQKNQADKRFTGLDAAFEKILKDWNAAGFSVAVVEKDKVIYAKGFGYRDYEKKLPVTPNTLFAIGSVTKSFTSSLMGLLQKEGKVDFDKPAVTYLPQLHFYNNEMNNSITLRHMMSHQTGLPRHDFSWYFFNTSSRDSILQRVQYQEPTFGIREKWQYNNFMFAAQGAIAEKIMGNSWEEAVKKNLLNPLEMNRSNFFISELAASSDASFGYTVRKDSTIKKMNYYNINSMGPAGSINSSATEMANWILTWINGGKYKGKEVLPAQYVSEAITPQAIIASGFPSKEKPDIHFSTYGFGWMMSSYRGHYRVEHGGNIDGFSASASFFPTDSIGIVVLSNQNGSSIPSIVRNMISDRLLGLKPYDWHGDLKKAADKAMAQQKEMAASIEKKYTATKPTHPLKEFEGTYLQPGYGPIHVFEKDDSLFARLSEHKIWLKHSNYNVFNAVFVDPVDGIDTTDGNQIPMQFHLNLTGEIESLTTPFEGGLDPLEFKKQAKVADIKKDELVKYVGDYDLKGVTVKVYIKNEKDLFVLVPGQPEYELVPNDKDKFALKIASGYYLQFNLNDTDEVVGMTFIQPNGNFTADRKK